MKGIRRTAERPRKAKPLGLSELRLILSRLNPRRPRDVRDAALLAVGFAGALRQSEIAGLDWQRRGAPGRRGTGTLRDTPPGFEIVLHVSKTSQFADVSIPIPDADAPSLRGLITRWVDLAGVSPGEPVFRQIGKGERVRAERLGERAVEPIIRERVRQMLMREGKRAGDAHVASMDYKGHSLRAGLATSLAAAGVQEWRIRERTRHKSAETVAGYVRLAESWTGTGLKRFKL